ncbi:MAG: HigA family addiction module antitoxin [Alphaproteobacteria bacterium]|nr:HigA family addiction module antitoxin [Alphaproteobacteria bacterium]
MEPHGLSAIRLAEAPGTSRNRIGDILRGRCGVTADTALRLEHAFGISAALRLNLQSRYELELARRRAGPTIDGIDKEVRFAGLRGLKRFLFENIDKIS